jgi:hypothetical protein
MARTTTTTQKKNTMMPGMAYPATVLALATATSYPRPPDLFGGCFTGDDDARSWSFRGRHHIRAAGRRGRSGSGAGPRRLSGSELCWRQVDHRCAAACAPARSCAPSPAGRSGRGLMVRAGPGGVTESARNAEASLPHDLRPGHRTRASCSGARAARAGTGGPNLRPDHPSGSSVRIIRPRTDESSGPARLYRRQPAAAVIVREPATAASPRSPRHDDRTKRSRPMGRLVLYTSMNPPIRLHRVRGAQ